MNSTLRNARRGSALASAMLFFVVVTTAGSALLAVSLIHRTAVIRASADVRLLIAAEAGLETRRGMFSLVSGVQDDWSGLLPSPGWNPVGSQMVINGVPVQVEGQPIGVAGNLQARLRATATGSDRRRVVQYTIKAASFADYALYFGANSSVPIGENFKMVGNYYSRGSINLQQQQGIEFFGRVETSEKVVGAPDPAYNFKKGYSDYVPVVTIPPTAYGLDPMRAAAQSAGTLHYGNTLSIELMGQQYRRTYEHRNSGSGTNYNHNHYQVRSETKEIPDNGVIYVDSDRAPVGVDSYASTTNTANRAQNGEIELWGTLDYKRVTVACEHEIHIANNISYKALLDDPNLRRFTRKESPEALSFREMLGVVSATDLKMMTPDWTALGASKSVSNNASLSPPDTGHFTNQYSVDGVYMGVGKLERGAVGPGSNRELWVCGGLINGNSNNTMLSSNFDRRNYDTDYRLQFTTPPYFLRAYGVTPLQVTGTWLTYEN